MSDVRCEAMRGGAVRQCERVIAYRTQMPFFDKVIWGFRAENNVVDLSFGGNSRSCCRRGSPDITTDLKALSERTEAPGASARDS